MVKTKFKTQYGLQTIGGLIEALTQYVEDNNYITMESPVFISDYAMSGYKHEFDILPTFSPYLHQAGVCLFHSLSGETESEPVIETEENIEEEDVEYNLEYETLEEFKPSTKRDISKFARFIKG